MINFAMLIIQIHPNALFYVHLIQSISMNILFNYLIHKDKFDHYIHQLGTRRALLP